ncbi:hypothetical protein BS78_10G101500 [Paspalum vaginatum]|nr:hypothetical protein BS78_10G101500 [Paspalum vaginatum]
MAAATTKTSSALAVVLLCLYAAAFLAMADEDLVAKACKNATGDQTLARRFHGPGLTRETCESTLRSDNRSAAAKHPRDLALIAMDLLLSAAADLDTKFDGVLRSSKLDRVTKLNLQFCRVDYGAVVARTVPVCRAKVQEYNPDARSHGQTSLGDELTSDDYFMCVDKLRNAAADCWLSLFFSTDMYNSGAKKAVWKEVVEAASHANLAKAMVEQMLGGEVENEF